MSDKVRLSLEARRLTAIQQSLGTDSFLQTLISLSTSDFVSFDTPIAMVVNGRLVRGRIAPPESFARHIDTQLERFANTATINAKVAEGQDKDAAVDQIRKGLVKGLSNAFTRGVEARRKREKVGRERLEATFGEPDSWDDKPPPSVDELPDDLALDLLEVQAPFTSLTLEQAEIYLDGKWLTLGLIRVVLSQVAAWWLPEID
jgi:hypothetical protein